MICPNCGHDNPAEADSCASCGDPLVAAEESPALAAAPAYRRTLVSRMVRAALLDGWLYSELRDDPTATLQAFTVMLLGGLAIAVALIIGVTWGDGLGTQLYVLTRSISAALVGWVITSLFALWVGKRLLSRPITLPIVLRAIGFANAPAILYILIAIGGTLALLINSVILFWILIAQMVAFRNTLRTSIMASMWLSFAGLFIALIVRDMLARALL